MPASQRRRRRPAVSGAILALLLAGTAAPTHAGDQTGAAFRLRGAHLNAGASPDLSGGAHAGGATLGQAAARLQTGAASSAHAGFWPLVVPLLPFVARLSGTAQGGSVSITIDGVRVVVITTAGQGAAQVAALLAEAITDESLLDVRAVAVAGSLLSEGSTTAPVSADPGIAVTGLPAVPALPALFALLLAAGGT